MELSKLFKFLASSDIFFNVVHQERKKIEEESFHKACMAP